MKRRLLITALATLAVAGVVRAATSSWELRVEAFRKEAAAQRKKLKLDRDRDALYADYPTPEVTFAGAGKDKEPAVVCPGKTETVKLEGTLVPGSLFVVESDDVEVLKEQATPTAWTATLKVKETAVPRDVMVNILTPVSEASRRTRVLDIGCAHTWTLDLATGQRLVVKTNWPKGGHGALETDGEWTQGAQALGTVRVSAHGSGTFTFTRIVPQEELMGQANAYRAMMASPEWKALDVRFTAAQKKLEPCTKLPPAQMGACMKVGADEMTVVAKEREALQKKTMAKGPKFGCDRVVVTAQPGGKLEGDAERCAGKEEHERVKVTGTVKSP